MADWLTFPGAFERLKKLRASESRIYGAVAAFDSDEKLLEAAARVRQAGYTKFDCHTPYPVHGLDRAMGLRRSRLPLIIIGGTITGFLTAYALQYWVGVIKQPVVIGNKPLFAIPYAVPVLFELSVLLTSFGAVLGMLALNGLPRLYHPLFNSENFKKSSDDTFFISIESKDPLFNEDKTVALLTEVGGQDVELVES
ncbi:MAG TPA: DUF3341 domain-containing protein [Blastocatellia bacterium]|nr:DUF3341 domain-containing protein [Blastocatellia bacterium]